MGEIVRWVKNITYYFILIHILFQLLPNGNYERYIRLFSGIVFVLLVVSPLTRGLNLEEKLAYAYEKIRFEQNTEEFSQRLWGMEEERLEEILRQYETAVSQDVKAMAEEEGLDCEAVEVKIESRREEEAFGQVVNIRLKLMGGQEEEELKEAEAAVGAAGVIQPVQVQVEAGPEDRAIGGETGKEREEKELGEQAGLEEEREARLSEFQRKVAEYYGLEERDIQAAW